MKRSPNLKLLAESLLLSAILISGLASALFFFRQGYLPQPFFFDVNDDFMDWYNTAYWAHHSGTYYIWKSVYPPIAFILTRVFSKKHCYVNNPFFSRDCDHIGICLLILFAFMNFYLMFRSFRSRSIKTALVRALALSLGFPNLFVLDRGNLIEVCLTSFLLGYAFCGPPGRLQRFADAVAINFKPYLLVLLAPHLVLRKWHSMESALSWTGIVYIISFIIFGSGSIYVLFSNEIQWAADRGGPLITAAYYSSSFKSVIEFLSHATIIQLKFGRANISLINFLMIILTRAGQVGALAALAGVALKKTPVPDHRIAALTLSLLMTSIDVGGYMSTFLFFLIFLDAWRGWAIGVALVSAYLSLISADVIIIPLIHMTRYVYLSGRDVTVNFGLGIGTFARPD